MQDYYSAKTAKIRPLKNFVLYSQYARYISFTPLLPHPVHHCLTTPVLVYLYPLPPPSSCTSLLYLFHWGGGGKCILKQVYSSSDVQEEGVFAVYNAYRYRDTCITICYDYMLYQLYYMCWLTRYWPVWPHVCTLRNQGHTVQSPSAEEVSQTSSSKLQRERRLTGGKANMFLM